MKSNDIIKPTFMTLVIGATCKHGIVLAGDRRNYDPTTTSYDDTAVKVFKLNDKVVVAGAGNRFDCLEIINEIIANPQIKNMSLEQVKDLIYNTARNKQAEMINKNLENPFLALMKAVANPEFAFILMGIDDKNKPKIYTFSHDNIVPRLITDKYLAVGFTDVPKYIFSKEYKENMSIKALIELASRSIKETSKISLGVSEVCDVVEISLV